MYTFHTNSNSIEVLPTPRHSASSANKLFSTIFPTVLNCFTRIDIYFAPLQVLSDYTTKVIWGECGGNLFLQLLTFCIFVFITVIIVIIIDINNNIIIITIIIVITINVALYLAYMPQIFNQLYKHLQN